MIDVQDFSQYFSCYRCKLRFYNRTAREMVAVLKISNYEAIL